MYFSTKLYCLITFRLIMFFFSENFKHFVKYFNNTAKNIEQKTNLLQN
jgi:hypothetical protein